MNWLFLTFAGILEIVWAIGLKYTNGFTKFLPSLITIVAMSFSFWFLSLALKNIPIGTAYSVWTGIGIIGTAVFGMIFLNEPIQFLRIAFITLILLGVIGLKFCH